MNKKSKSVFIQGIIIALVSTGAIAEDSYKLYGAVKLSIDKTSNGSGDSVNSVNNHDSRFGIKGSRKLDDDLTAVYQLELGVDMTERNAINSGRNSFLGVKGKYGQIALGQYDTPFKKIRGNGTNIFGDTIADVRSLVSVAVDPGAPTKQKALLDDRAKNAVWYKSPAMNNVTFVTMYSADMSSGNKPDEKKNDLTSTSLTYKKGPLFVAAGFLLKSDPYKKNATNPADMEATRVGASYKYGAHRAGALYESSHNGAGDQLTRDVYAINVYSKVDGKNSVGVQYSKIQSYEGSTDTGASNISIGVEHKYSKATMFYMVATKTTNDKNAQFGLAQSGTGENFSASYAGATTRGISAGTVLKF